MEQALQAENAPRASVLLYDNSPPTEDRPTEWPAGFRYLRADTNRGWLGAYEAATAAAEEQTCDWLLTLDQDTALPRDFFAALAPDFAIAAADQRVGVIVPHLVEQGRLLSPAYVSIGRPRPVPAGFTGVPLREARAFNSGALLRVRAVQSLGGFDPCFWLDHLDSWLHHQLFVRGWRMYVAGSLTLQHQLSLLDVKQRVSSRRFQDFLAAEAAYIDLYGTLLARTAYTGQLAVRCLRQIMRRDPIDIRSVTRDALLTRLMSGREARIARWRLKNNCTPSAEARS